MTLFNTSAFDLDAYLERIGYSGRPSADLATLQTLALRHPSAIAFENLNPLLRRPVRLDLVSIQEKLVHGGRGGWCFEHNLLLGTALTAVGYDVTGLSARVIWNTPPGVVRSRTHMVLLVTLDRSPWVVDCGFGGSTLTGPIRLEADTEQTTPHEPFRLTPSGHEFRLDARLQGEWKALYEFSMHPQKLPDYEMANWYLCNHPESHFLSAVVAARVESDRRYALRNSDFAIHHRDGFTERRALRGGAEIRSVLEDVFLIRVPAGADVDETFERIAASQSVSI